MPYELSLFKVPRHHLRPQQLDQSIKRIQAHKPCMRRLRYSVAVSLDGFIAGPNGEYDWIIMDPSIDFEGFFKEFDTLLMGRRTFEFAGGGSTPGVRTIVCS